VPKLVLVAVLAAPALWLPSALAQRTAAGASAVRTQGERNAVELKQGMTLDEVQQLLGKPVRTALRGGGGSGSSPSQGSLQWTYVWSSAASSSGSSSERSLNIEFAARTAEQWAVVGWGWSTY